MKILMVTMAMNIGGAETHILELTKELSLRGHDVTVASFGGVYADELQKLLPEALAAGYIRLFHAHFPPSVLRVRA